MCLNSIEDWVRSWTEKKKKNSEKESSEFQISHLGH